MQLLTFLYACIWLNRYYRGVVQGITKEKYYSVLFDDGYFCNDLRSADIVVSTILATCVFTDLSKLFLRSLRRRAEGSDIMTIVSYCYRHQTAEKTIFRWEAWCKWNGELNKSCLSQKLLTDLKSIRYELLRFFRNHLLSVMPHTKNK